MKSDRTIAVLEGDGIGPEVMRAAIRVLEGVGFEANYRYLDVGWEFWCREGNALPARTLDGLKGCDAALFGAITSKTRSEADVELISDLHGCGFVYTSPIVKLRQQLDLFSAIRPCRSLAGNPLNARDNIDLVVFRENTEGLYGGIEWFPVPEQVLQSIADPDTGHPERMKRWLSMPHTDVALSTRVMSRSGCERIVRSAFEYAQQHGRTKVTLLEKPNVLRATGQLMCDVFREVAESYPDLQSEVANIDAACMHLVMSPERFDVIVAENMFGDIVSDLAAGLVGGLGFAPSANVGESFAVFEPTHGSAPDIAGQGIANPTGMILAAAMMLRWLGDDRRALAVEDAVQTALLAGKIDTPDVTGHVGDGTTQSVTESILKAVEYSRNREVEV